MKLLSLFSGCGGFDLGFKQAGFDIIWANDISKDAALTYENNIGSHIVTKDITNISSSDIPNDIDVVIGGFPCQGFSIANTKRCVTDKRNFLYEQMLRIVKVTQPKFFVAENVKGLLSMENGQVIQMIVNDFKSIGYNVDYQLLKASDYGVPQHRERVFIIGNNINVENPFPSKTHGTNNDLFNQSLKPYLTVKDVIGHLYNVRQRDDSFELNGVTIHNHTARTNVSDTFFERKHTINQSDICDYLTYWKSKKNITIKQIDNHFGYKHTAGHWFRKDKFGSIPSNEDWFGLKSLLDFDDKFDNLVTEKIEKQIVFEQSLRISNWNTPSDTITATNPEIHPNRNRRLSVRECAIIQSFPDDFIFYGSLSSMYRQIGNAVPPLLAKHIAIELLNKLKTNDKN